VKSAIGVMLQNCNRKAIAELLSLLCLQLFNSLSMLKSWWCQEYPAILHSKKAGLNGSPPVPL